MLQSRIKDIFLSLVRLGIGTSAYGRISSQDGFKSADWSVIEALASQHGLSGVVLDGIDLLVRDKRLPAELAMDDMMKKQWIGQVLQGYEYRYELYRRTLGEMAAFYNKHGFKMMVLKGYACSLDWPKPEHRPSGDIDIWLFGRCREADEVLAKEKKVEVDNSHHHHTVYYWNDFMVENHYDFINVHHHKSHAEFEKIFKELGADDSYSVDIRGEKVYLPSPNLHALFLLKHTMMHFAAESISLRQLLDWAFFVRAHGSEVDWGWLEGELVQFGMKRLYDVFNAICVEDLGFEVGLFPRIQFDPILKERVLTEILEPDFSGELPRTLLRRSFYKLRRWRRNAWKHKLCYKDSLWSAFWTGVWGHLMKPKSI